MRRETQSWPGEAYSDTREGGVSVPFYKFLFCPDAKMTQKCGLTGFAASRRSRKPTARQEASQDFARATISVFLLLMRQLALTFSSTPLCKSLWVTKSKLVPVPQVDSRQLATENSKGGKTVN